MGSLIDVDDIIIFLNWLFIDITQNISCVFLYIIKVINFIIMYVILFP